MARRPAKKDIVYVGIQLLLFVLYILPFHFFPLHIHPAIKTTGQAFALVGLMIVFIAILQLNKTLSAFPTPRHKASLVQIGLFKYIRHPIYSGVMLTAFGFGINQQSTWKLAISALLCILFFFKSKYEEQLLLVRFSDYRQYMKKSYRFFPFL